MALEIDQVHHVIETSVNGLSILLNCYLLYLIKQYSTFGVKIYKYLLTVDAILDLCLCSVVFLVQPFVYRYRLLCKDNAQSTQSNLVIVTVTITYSIIAFFIVYTMSEVVQEFQPTGQHIFDLNKWPRQNGTHLLIAGSYITEWRVLAYLSMWLVTCSVSVVTVIWCEKQIAKHFNRLGAPTHCRTQKMHTEFHRALLAMAICPLITTTAPLYYFCTTFVLKMCPGRISATMTSATTFITLFNPLTTIICFRCYRQATIRLVTCSRKGSSLNPTCSLPTKDSLAHVRGNTANKLSDKGSVVF
ncbi:serpentine type 7TM GPCR chemoreceptor srd domain-containing protein [Ditylenchus destructor]|uniref:Serpentine type 7TM GPCR chemoreceptor srd domain-containing protein n=1 Tax=Ditylenchus destructor TaxID=166010 RepID=A0AAD4QZU5_9BILA|nr:serpentine type 7TM GPCR chemoreceptor srd domain-containing protein [Ditylenchus destructor]